MSNKAEAASVPEVQATETSHAVSEEEVADDADKKKKKKKVGFRDRKVLVHVVTDLPESIAVLLLLNFIVKVCQL